MEYRVNDIISLRLEDKKTFIYLGGNRYQYCIRLVLNIPKCDTEIFDRINSIDEAAELLETLYQNKAPPNDVFITPEEEFRGHCSNLQAWVDNDYNTDILHSRLSFSLLRELVKLGDKAAKRIFKEEVTRRFSYNSISVMLFLLEENYLDHFNLEELEEITEAINFEALIRKSDSCFLFKHLLRLGVEKARQYFKEEMKRLIADSHNLECSKSIELILSGFLDEFDLEEVRDLFSKFDFSGVAIKHSDLMPNLLKKLTKYGVYEARSLLEDHNFLQRYLTENDIPFFLEINAIVGHSVNIVPREHRTDSFFLPYSPYIIIDGGRIVELDLSGLQLKQIPRSIGALSKLEKLDLSKNSLNSLPDSISNLELLTELKLSYNFFKEFPKLKLKSVKILRLDSNELEVSPDLRELTSLEDIDLSRNNLTNIHWDFFKLDRLKHLNLNFNRVQEFPDGIRNFTELESLYCEYNDLRHISNRISELSNLKSLFLDGNPIVSIPTSIKRLTSLNILSLNFRPDFLSEDIVSIPPYHIQFKFEHNYYIWARGEKTSKKYGIAIQPSMLPLKNELIEEFDELNKEYVKIVFSEDRDVGETFVRNTLKKIREARSQLGAHFLVEDMTFKSMQ